MILHCASEATEVEGGLKTSGRFSSIVKTENRFGNTNVLLIFTLVLVLGEKEDNRFCFVDSDVEARDKTDRSGIMLIREHDYLIILMK
jgi:hypothetical protein